MVIITEIKGELILVRSFSITQGFTDKPTKVTICPDERCIKLRPILKAIELFGSHW